MEETLARSLVLLLLSTSTQSKSASVCTRLEPLLLHRPRPRAAAADLFVKSPRRFRRISPLSNTPSARS